VNPTTSSESQDINNTYIWRNRLNTTGSILTTVLDGSGFHEGLTMDCTAYGGYSDVPKRGRDWFDDTGTSLVGCGTLASLPVTCTIGVGYWATNQSCSNLTGMVGKNPSSPISGTLYKCTSTNTWTAYYTPYTYPHPLRGEGGPPIPQGLGVEKAD
jgi:hypothetical protein